METAEEKPVHLARELSRIHPIAGLVHVGSGLGLGDMHQWQKWGVKDALLIEADAGRNGWTSPALAENPGWKRLAETISWQDGETEFFVATNPAENGLLDPELLKPIWPNLETRETRGTTSRRLDTVLGDCRADWLPDWLLIDCLPALAVLRGAEGALSHCAVVWTRVILDENLTQLDGARLSSVERHLAACGFRRVAAAEGSHPAVGEALFVRDWRALLMPESKRRSAEAEHNAPLRTTLETKQASLEQARETLAEKRDRQADRLAEQQELIHRLMREREEQARLAGDYKVQVDTLSKARDEQSRMAAERQRQIEELKKEWKELQAGYEQLSREVEALNRDDTALRVGKSELEARLAALEQEKTRLNAAREAQARLADEFKSQAEVIAQARDELSRLATERQERIGELAQAQDELKKQAEALRAGKEELERAKCELQAEVDRLSAENTEKAARIAQFEAQQEETALRQQLFNEEMIKAEAQIDLIKDVLLREPGL